MGHVRDLERDECDIDDVYKICSDVCLDLIGHEFFWGQRGKWSLAVCDEKGPVITFEGLSDWAAELAKNHIRKKAIECDFVLGLEIRYRRKIRFSEWITLDSTT